MKSKGKPMHVISAKITPDQRSELEAILGDRTMARFTFDAIREKAIREGIDWPEYDWSGHDGKRPGAGRPPKSE